MDEVSAPVVSEFGVHLVKLTEDAENVFVPFEEARDRIERDLKSSEVELIYAERLQDLSNLAFETGDLQTISEDLGLAVLQSEPIRRNGGGDVFNNQNAVDAVFSDEVLLDGNNSDVIELNDAQSVVVRVESFNASSVLPVEEVQPEIAVILRTEMERQAVQDLGNQLAEALETGQGLEELLIENDLEWIDETEINRDAFTVNREVIDTVFALPRPQGEPELASITLSNGTFVLAELHQVNEGSIDSIPEEERLEIEALIATDLGSSEFQAYLNTLRENSDIQTSLEDFGL